MLVVAALWWQWAQTQKQSQVGKAAPGVNSLTAAAVSGIWRGEVTYSGGTTYTERFLFQVEGDKLFGTASFLGFKRGIEDGRIDGDKISFNVRFHEAVEGVSTERTNRYAGSVSDNQIHLGCKTIEVSDRWSSLSEKKTGQSNGRLLWHTTRS